VRAESGVEGENERLKTIQEHVNPRTFSAESAEKIRHPREFQSCMGLLRCRAEGFATRPPPRVSSLHGFTPVPRGRVCHPPESAEKIRHPREFQSCMGSLRCRAEGFATRRKVWPPATPASFNCAWVHSGAAPKGSPPAVI
jgi:hypothetical protein